MSGSVVLAAYGADLQPGDLDAVPDPDPANLGRLARLLYDLGAVPAYVDHWADGPSLEACRQWRAEPATLDNLDHAFVTPLGVLDVPPSLTGTYAELRPTATVISVAGVAVRLCDPEQVLRRLPSRPRAKDRDRSRAYAAVRARVADDDTPATLDHLL